MKISRLPTCLALSCLASIAEAGVYIEHVTRNADGREQGLQKMYVQNGMARIESGGARPSVIIFRDETLNVLDATNKSYQAIDKKMMEQTTQMMDDMLAKLPPDQRAKMEQMMKQMGMPAAGAPAKPVVYAAKATGESATIEGRGCKMWLVTRDGAPSEQLCVVPMNLLPGAAEVATLGKKMTTIFESFSKPMREMMGSSMEFGSAALSKIDGYPVMMRSYRNGQLAQDQRIVKVWREQALDAAQFEIPAGYKKTEMPKLRSN